MKKNCLEDSFLPFIHKNAFLKLICTLIQTPNDLIYFGFFGDTEKGFHLNASEKGGQVPPFRRKEVIHSPVQPSNLMNPECLVQQKARSLSTARQRSPAARQRSAAAVHLSRVQSAGL